MGRYYTGDIEGKFWFGVQDSDDANFFGGYVEQPNYLECHFEQEDEKDVAAGIEKCKQALGDCKAKLDEFFASHEYFDDDTLIDAGFPEKKIRNLLIWYARLELGEKILSCLQKKGSCHFEAEL